MIGALYRHRTAIVRYKLNDYEIVGVVHCNQEVRLKSFKLVSTRLTIGVTY